MTSSSHTPRNLLAPKSYGGNEYSAQSCILRPAEIDLRAWHDEYEVFEAGRVLLRRMLRV